jgi:hypothetical protein
MYRMFENSHYLLHLLLILIQLLHS